MSLKKLIYGIALSLMFVFGVCTLSACDLDNDVKNSAISITSIVKTGSEGLVDTYTIYFSDGSTGTFSVTNGKDGVDGTDGNGITNIEKTKTDGSNDTYTITFSDGSTQEYTVTNGVDGENGQNGKNGTDGKSLTIDDVYKWYRTNVNENATYEDFLKYLSENYLNNNNTSVHNINKSLQSTMKLYTEFIVGTTSTNMFGQTTSTTYNTSVYTGSAVIYSIMDNDYTYIITNYHVVYLKSADATRNSLTDKPSNFARHIYGYLYGSECEDDVSKSETKDENGYTQYTYGGNVVELEYVDGSVSCDVAVLRAKTADLKKVNENISAVTFADDYYVGETVYAIGNSAAFDLSVSSGIVSIDNQNIELDIDGTERTYRSLRFDAETYSGISGGGLFNSKGELIGLCNAGATQYDSINYAVPVQVVKNAVENIVYYANDGKSATEGVMKFSCYAVFSSQNSRYVYDEVSGYGNIVEDVIVSSVGENSQTVENQMGMKVGDVVKSVVVTRKTSELDGEQTVEKTIVNTYEITRAFQIDDLYVALRTGDVVQFTVEREVEVTETVEGVETTVTKKQSVELEAYTVDGLDFAHLE